MATNIKSTNLDFQSIKNNLKNYFNNSEMSDYNFDASALNNLLDVLAWNTHYNALTSNFTLNEAYLNTAQLRSSVISLAENVGYIPKSRSSSNAIINLSVILSGITNPPDRIELEPYYVFNGTLDNKTYQFVNKDKLYGYRQNENSNTYVFKNNITDSEDIVIYEGKLKVKSFIVDQGDENAIYVIPDKNLDISSAIIKVYPTSSTLEYTTYNNIKNVSVLNEDSRVYILKEAPNGYFELTFGGGTTLGASPTPGNKIEVEYISTSGIDGNGVATFSAPEPFIYDGQSFNLRLLSIQESMGGENPENIESIRKNAPFQYASQNRAVTAVDYKSLILREFSSYIDSGKIRCYGGEEAENPKYGSIFVSMVSNLNDQTEIDRLKANITTFIKEYSVVSFNLEFIDPIKTEIDCTVTYEFNPKYTTETVNKIDTDVNTVITSYFNDNTGDFEQSFRRSQMLALVDDVSPAVLSSKADISLVQRITPQYDKKVNYTIKYPVSLSAADDDTYIVKSSFLIYNNYTCYIRNKLSSTQLELVRVDDGEPIISNCGEYFPVSGVVNITGLNINRLFGRDSQLKINAVPANQSSVSPQLENYIAKGKIITSAVIVSTK